MRLEAIISLSPDGKLPSYKVEVKNINSFRYFANAMTYEYKRHSEILDQGQVPVQETRGYRASTSSTASQRVKEDAADYRYFPDPDIPPIVISKEWLEQIKSRLPELPSSKIDKLVQLGIVESAAKIIVNDRGMMDYIDQVKKLNSKYVQSAANDLVNKKIDHKTMTPDAYVIEKDAKSANKITDESVLKPIIEKILADNQSVVTDYKSGKQNALGFFVGAAMKATAGKADAGITNKILKDLLN
jgi:aspartyl-tRNA(Asn)/glutamyl-tRNA(Gln) amidotransferase subunit B